MIPWAAAQTAPESTAMETRTMKTLGINAKDMHRMPAGRAARVVSGISGASAYAWHVIPCSAEVQVFADTTKLPARRLSEAPL
jgi:hypothetical protein